MIEELPNWITTLGFPIAVVIYLLWERQGTTKELNRAIDEKLVVSINELRVEIVKLNERIHDMTRNCCEEDDDGWDSTVKTKAS
ncbi:MAG: hypothetical protein ACP5E9_10410 [Candidatus Methanospirareceae archaeon]